MKALSNRQKIFVENYLITWNANEAARRAGYKSPSNHSSEIMKHPAVAAAIKARIDEVCMTADEVRIRETEYARADIGSYLSDGGEIDIAKMKRQNATHMLRKVKRTERSGVTKSGLPWKQVTLEIELHDQHAANVNMGKIHGLYGKSDDDSKKTEFVIRVEYGDKRTDDSLTEPAQLPTNGHR